ncbi:hypothetical protein [Alteromonas sp. CYL-A6]|uniref:hypothetical protein n=1 Tax=Alteromonas nitratireducens TaxID=3390813 RepID=UPI0034C391C0
MSKKLSSGKKPSAFSSLMRKGQQKVKYRADSGRLLMQLTENDHKQIALLIRRWLDDTSEKQ